MRWLGVRLELIGHCVVAFVAFFIAAAASTLTPGSAGVALVYSLTINRALQMLVRNVTDLELGGHKTAGDLDLPEGISLITPAETVLTHIEQPKGASEETADALAEPEVISKGGDKSEGEG